MRRKQNRKRKLKGDKLGEEREIKLKIERKIKRGKKHIFTKIKQKEREGRINREKIKRKETNEKWQGKTVRGEEEQKYRGI